MDLNIFSHLSPTISFTLSLLFLLITSSLVFILSKKIDFPYTVLLVIVWIFLVPLSKIWFLWFIDDFKLTPDMLFFIFLPILVFEWAFNIDYSSFKKVWKSVSILAILWVLISAIIVAWLLYFIFPIFGFNIPFLVCFLFGAIISSTDPVAVLSIFKSMWAPKRLTMIFEGESLFNDWTSVALFNVILWIILGTSYFFTNPYVSWTVAFSSMIILWIIFGWIIGYLFSKLIWKINYNQEAEITLAILSAYVTYLLTYVFSEHFKDIPVSPIIATVISSMVLWNYWRYKINPKSSDHMTTIVEIFSFISNSLVFISIWLIFASVEIKFSTLVTPIIISICAMMIWRFSSIYLWVWIVNLFKLERNISINYQNLLFWWWLRWVLAIIMVFMIPDNWMNLFEKSIWWNNLFSFGIKDFLLSLTLWNIIFTLLVNATTISYIMKKMWVDKLHSFEKVEYTEWKILTKLKILWKLKKYFKKWDISKDDYSKLRDKYEQNLSLSIKLMKKDLEWDKKDVHIFAKRLIYKYCLWVQKYHLKNLYFYKKINEKNFKYILSDIDYQLEKLDAELKNENNIVLLSSNISFLDKFVKINNFFKEKFSELDMYIIYRTRYLIIKKSVKELEKIPKEIFLFDDKITWDIIDTYKKELDYIDEKRKELLDQNKGLVETVEKEIINKSFLKLEEKLLNDLYLKWIIPNSYYLNSKDDLELKLYWNNIQT